MAAGCGESDTGSAEITGGAEFGCDDDCGAGGAALPDPLPPHAYRATRPSRHAALRTAHTRESLIIRPSDGAVSVRSGWGDSAHNTPRARARRSIRARLRALLCYGDRAAVGPQT